ncbi:MAG: hypothetical protein EH225_09760 [Calditrichaeota bacterium]|nr:MAG: hypothetical protein EH225_09760 [Calditrichota bacterium]
MNQKRRLNWGGLIGHIPYRSVRTFASLDTVNVNGQQVIGTRYDVVFQRIFVQRAWSRLEFPLSQNRRLEFNTGYTRIAFSQERETFVSIGGFIVDRRKEDLGGPPALNLFQSSAAYVGDYSFFGFTSPVNGRRYRFEVQPTFGSLRYMTFLADYRHYFFANPVTFALRLYHEARYLKDAEDNRLSPMFLGYETLVRGYSIGSIDAAECTDPENPDRCPVYDRLIGSRIGIFNAEIRLPLFGTQQFGLINFPYLPTELAAFFDGGVAWTQDEQPEITWKERSNKRIPVFSTGLAARVNLLGYIVGQVYYAIPFQRPEKDGLFGFVFAAGW